MSDETQVEDTSSNEGPPEGDVGGGKAPDFGIEYVDPKGGDKDEGKKSDSKDKKPSESKSKKPEKDEKKPEKKPARQRKFKMGDDRLDYVDNDDDETDISDLKVTRKVNGKEVQVSLGDLGKNYELRQASYERHEQNNERERRWQAGIDAMRNDYKSAANFLRDEVGIDPVKWANDTIMEQIRMSELQKSNPEQWKRETMESMQAEQRGKFQREQQAQQRWQQQQQQRQIQQQYTQDIRAGLEGHDLMDDIGLGTLMLLENRFHRMGRNPMQEAPALLAEARDLMNGALEKRIQSLPVEALVKMLGAKQMQALNAHQIAQMKGKGGSNGKSAPTAKPKEAPVSTPPRRKYSNMSEILREFKD